MSIDPEQYVSTQQNADRRIVMSSPGVPSADVVAALEDGLVNVIRRVELYEADGDTLWNPDAEADPGFARLIDGNVTVDYNSDERRVLDLALDNRDNLLRFDPFGGLWYDKVVKVFRGVSFIGGNASPRTAIVEAPTSAAARLLRQFLSTLGYTDVDILTDVTSIDELLPYSVFWSYTGTSATSKESILTQLWSLGKHIFTISSGNRVENTPHYFSETEVSISGTWNIKPTQGDSPVAGSFIAGPGGNGTGWAPSAVAVGVVPLALADHPTDATPTIGASLATHASGGYWVDLHTPGYSNTQTKKFLRAASDWVRGVGLSIEWETQIGEFMIDGLAEANFPDQVKVTGRDYAKKMKQSKLTVPTTFEVGTKLKDLVEALAVNAGINPNKMRIGISNEVLTSDMTYDTGADRWAIAKEACLSFNYEIFFDQFGWFTVRKFIDPYTGPTAWTFKTGEDGNLVSFDKSLSDSEIYNVIVVTSTPSDDATFPFYAVARNDDPTSPTRVERLGERVLPIEANYLGSTAECQELADAMLKIHALEQYALNKSSVYYPWLDVGQITEILDPDATDFEPTRYLLDSLNFGLGLGPMSGTAKRVTIVGQTGNPPEE